MTPLFKPILFGSGKLLLLGTSSVALGFALYRQEPTERIFVRMGAATLLLFYFGALMSGLFSLSEQLTQYFTALGSKEGLKDLIFEALKTNSFQADPNGAAGKFNLPGAVEQIWRTGVWGVISLLSECFFLLSSLLLEISREITIQIVWILYPLVVGVMPVFPGVTATFLVHVICVSLWWPIFTLITVVMTVIARHYMAHTNSWGLSILALEVIACLMTCAVPMIAHRLVSGAISQTSQQLSVTHFQSSVSNHVSNIGGDSK